MIKIIDLGFEVPETGERRISLIDDSMVKTASNDIQSFWSSFPREKDKGYLHVIAMTDGNIYGPNNNGDWFDGADLKKYHPSFTKDGHVFMFHMNKDPKKAIGKPIYSFYNDHMSRVELVLEFNKLDPGAVMLVTKLKNNEQVYVSMGVKVDHDVCSVCRHESKTRSEYCFVGGTLVTMFDGAVKPISTIVPGDVVLDAEGLKAEVVATSNRLVNEKILSLSTSLNGFKTKVTKNHPFLISNREDSGKCYYQVNGNAETISCFPNSRAKCVECKKAMPKKFFVEASELRVNDVVYSPIVSSDYFDNSVIDAEEAWVVGLFMAEGSYGKQPGKLDGKLRRTSLNFTLNGETEQDYIGRLTEFFKCRYNKDLKIYPTGNKGVNVRIHSREISDKYFSYVGEYAAQKRLSGDIFYSRLNVISEYLQGLWDGDGYIPPIRCGRVISRLNSSSLQLITQTSMLLYVLGYDTFYSMHTTVGGPTDRKKWLDQFYTQGNYKQSPLLEKEYGASSYRGRDGGYIVGHIKGIEEEHYTGPVYNLETTSGTYIANGVAVHNCDHLRYNMKKILPDGRQVYAENPGPLKFFDISVVNKPADKVAWALEKEAAEGHIHNLEPVIKTSAERGEEYTDHQAKLAGLKKISDMIKQVDGDIADMDTQDKEPAYTRLRRLKEQNVRHLEYPVLDYGTMDTMDASPGGMIRVILSTGAPPSIGELAYAAGKHTFGNRMDESVIPSIMRMIPSALQLIKGNPSLLDSVPAMMSNYDGELENPNRYMNLRQQIQPVMSRRIMIIKMACEDGQLEKLAAGVVHPGVPAYDDGYKYKYSKAPIIRLAKDIVNSAVNPELGALDQVHTTGRDGNIVTTNRHNRDLANTVGKFVPQFTDLLGAAILSVGGAAMLSDASALEKLITAALTVSAAAPLLTVGRNDPKIQTREHIEIPSHTPLFRGEQGIRKTAAPITPSAPGTSWAEIMKDRGPAIFGMAVPAVLGLDYLYNRHIKYRNDTYPEDVIEGFPSRMAYKAGRAVSNNPLTSIVGGGILGTIGKEYLAGKFKK